jgi:hypothetical protein
VRGGRHVLWVSEHADDEAFRGGVDAHECAGRDGFEQQCSTLAAPVPLTRHSGSPRSRATADRKLVLPDSFESVGPMPVTAMKVSGMSATGCA